MIAAVILPLFPVKAGAGRNIDLAAQDWLDPDFLCLLIKIDHAVHDTMVRDGKAVHPQFLCPGKHLTDLAGTI